MGHNVPVFVRFLKVVGKLVIHHGARDEAALVEVIERFILSGWSLASRGLSFADAHYRKHH
jgi:hypothetical protein